MKHRIHQGLVGLLLAAIAPCSILALLLMIGAITEGIGSGFSVSDVFAIVLLLVPSLLAWWGFRLFFRLYGGFFPELKKTLIFYYGCVAAYCSLWLFSGATRGGHTEPFFSRGQQVLGLIILIMPLILAIAMRADSTATPPNNEDAEQDMGLDAG